MKTKNFFLSTVLLIGIATAFTACSRDSNSPEDSVLPAGDYSLFVVDTNRILSVNTDGGNSKLLTQVAQGPTKSTFISDMSGNPERTKIAYLVRKGDPGTYSTEVRIADFGGGNDKLLLAISENSAMPGSIKYGSGGKIYYNYMAGTSNHFYSVNDDGSGNTSKQKHQFEDLSNDGRYLLRFGYNQDPNKTVVQVLDLAGDNGAGSNKFFKTFDLPLRSMKLSADGSKVAAVYRDGNEIKLLVADVNTETISQKTVATSSNSYSLLFVSFAPDNKTVICTDAGDISKTYIYSLDAGTSASFNNLNKDVNAVYAF